MKKYSIPKGIEKEAAEYIQGVLAELENRGVLENIDNAALDMLARNYSTFILSLIHISEPTRRS